MSEHYNFDEIIDRRSTDSVKWSINERLFGHKDVISMWVADMDFRSPDAVIKALVTRAQEGIYGYTTPTESYRQALVDWLAARHQWMTQKEWQVTTPGVVPAVIAALLAFTQPGDKVIIQPPVYYPFFKIVLNNGRQIIENTLLENDGYYTMDFASLEQQLADPRVRMMLLCNPHNPVGRVWTREELTRLGELCLQRGVLLVSDEIHSDLVFSWAKHTPAGSLSSAIEQITISQFAPSKTFNIAGLHTAVTVIANPELRVRFQQVVENLGMSGSTIFGKTGLEAAYREGGEWLSQVLVYLEENFQFMKEFIQREIPQLRMRIPEGTYLAWLDCRSLGLNREDLKRFMIEKAGLGLDEGAVFGKSGEGFMRVNIGCPRAVLRQALEQLATALR